MEDPRAEIVEENGYDVVSIVAPTGEREGESPGNSTDACEFSNETQGISVDEEPKLPILKKFDDLSDKIQNLRKDHVTLSNEVKDISTSSFPGSEVLNALQQLSVENKVLKRKHEDECELLKKKYLDECSVRKRLYNEVIELKGNIRVFCRCRPLNEDELADGASSCIEIDPSQDHELHVLCSDLSKKQFKFDHVFGPQASQEDIFAETSPIVTSVLDGYNVCIFAYGQTGTGKTFTMEGTPENRGVNYRTLEELFRISNKRSGTMRYELCVSMLEVYNEKIRDLLVDDSSQPAKKLEIKQAAEGTQEVPGVVEAHVFRTEEVWELLKSGNRVRSVGSTNANELSSRSHCLLRVTIKGENLVNGQRTKSNLWLVDLAGSERVGRIEVEGERLKESQFINKSLSALGDVISALASKTAHVPYRNSKLTHMLQSSLGGDCKTLMFVQISPNAADLGETLCSLNFASRVKGIEHGPAHRHVDNSELLKYKQMAEKLKHDEKETKKLQDNVQSLQLRLIARDHMCKTLQQKVRDLENQLAEERKMRLKQENRAVAAASKRPPLIPPRQLSQKTVMPQKRPLLGPSNSRMPLRKISNFLPTPSPIQAKKTNPSRPSFIPSLAVEGKENNTICASSTKPLMRPRRISIALRPPSQMTVQALQPKRRVSIATMQPDPPASSSQIGTPINAQCKRESVMQRPSFLKETSRVRRFSKIFQPLLDPGVGAGSCVEATPKGSASSSRFMVSPPTQIGSWRPKHPTVLALQKKPMVWSPLKMRGLKNTRKSSIFP